jgi:hypothetical protein
MRISQDVQEYTDGMAQKAKEFKQKGSELYVEQIQ